MKKTSISRWLQIALVALLFSACLFFPAQVKAGMESAVSQCFSAVLPSLFPIFIGMELLHHLPGESSASMLLSPLKKFLRLSDSGCSVFAIGILSGYPAGVSALCSSLENREIGRNEAIYLLHFCSNAGPAFLFGVIGGAVFHSLAAAALLWAIQILSSILTALIFRPEQQFVSIPKNQNANGAQPPFFILLLQAIRNAEKIMLLLCTYIVAFSVPVSILDILPNIPELFRTVAGGLLELSGGVLRLSESSLPDYLQLVLVSGFCAFGGLCVFAQSAEFLVRSKLPLRPLFTGKCVQTMFAVILSVSLFGLKAAKHYRPENIIFAAILLVAIIFLLSHKNRTGNQAKSCV